MLPSYFEGVRNIVVDLDTTIPTPTEYLDSKSRAFGNKYMLGLEEAEYLASLVTNQERRDKRKLIEIFAGQLLAFNEKRQRGEYN